MICIDCEYDGHYCRGCGEPTEHDEGNACAECREEYNEVGLD